MNLEDLEEENMEGIFGGRLGGGELYGYTTKTKKY